MRQEPAMNDDYPLRLSIDYPDRNLNRLTSALRIFTVIPIAIVGRLASTQAVARSSRAARARGAFMVRERSRGGHQRSHRLACLRRRP